MKTITFYSYKGGSSRSLSLIILAYLLRRIGKNVCMIDFDFEAPGLHHKLKVERKIKQGLVEYLYDCHQALSKWEDLRHPEVKRVVNQIGSYAVTVKRSSNKRLGEKLVANGWIKLIAAGNTNEATDYWRKVHFEMPKVFQFSPYPFDSEDDKKINAEESWKNIIYNNRLLLFDKVKTAIEAKIKPDYLLVDARNGVLERDGICIRLWADDVVCLIVPNRESLIGARMILRGLQAAGRLPGCGAQAPLNIVPVISRLPKLEKTKRVIDNKVDNFLKYLNEPSNSNNATLHFNNLATILEDPRLLIEERSIINDISQLNGTQLLLENIELFNKVVLEEDKQQLEDIKIAITKSARVFKMNRNKGELINPADSERNVAFRTSTFAYLLNQLAENLKKTSSDRNMVSSKKPQGAPENINRVIGKAGIDSGLHFAKDLLSQWEAAGQQLTLQEKLEAWCDFDSDAGFGRFRSSIDDRGNVEVVLTHSFLSAKKQEKSIDTSTFIKGYVKGVLVELIGGRIEVSNIEVTDSSNDNFKFTLKTTKEELGD